MTTRLQKFLICSGASAHPNCTVIYVYITYVQWLLQGQFNSIYIFTIHCIINLLLGCFIYVNKLLFYSIHIVRTSSKYKHWHLCPKLGKRNKERWYVFLCHMRQHLFLMMAEADHSWISLAWTSVEILWTYPANVLPLRLWDSLHRNCHVLPLHFSSNVFLSYLYMYNKLWSVFIVCPAHRHRNPFSWQNACYSICYLYLYLLINFGKSFA